MRYPQSLLDEIRARLSVSRVVEPKVKLKRAGREYIGLSPFKVERTPSFTVNDQKGFYHCFATGEHGDIFKFLMATEGLNFNEAVERLASLAGVSLPKEPARDQKAYDRELRLYNVLEAACGFFQAALHSEAGAKARKYLLSRGVEAGEISKFRLGFAPEGKSALKDELARKGFTLREMEEAGLLIHGDDIPVPYDRFRGRLIFPITDLKNRVIAFGGRALGPDQQPKYLNSPETPLFHKGRILFNHFNAREHGRKDRRVIVAEGYMDVIALSRAGFPFAVAPLGTALTEDQLRLLWALSPAPVLCFDGDAAGKKAAFRALETALPLVEPERSLEFVFLPEGQDPDDLLRKKGADALGEALRKSADLLSCLWLREEASHPLKTPEDQARFETSLFAAANKIQNAVFKRSMLDALKLKLKERGFKAWQRTRPVISPDLSWRELSGQERQKPGARHKQMQKREVGRSRSLLNSAVIRQKEPVGAVREALLVRALLHHPWLIDDYSEEIAALSFEVEECQRLRNAILVAHGGEIGLDSQQLTLRLLSAGLEALVAFVQELALRNGDGDFAASDDGAKDLESWRHLCALHQSAGAEQKLLPKAEQNYRQEATDENFAEICAIRQQPQIALG